MPPPQQHCCCATRHGVDRVSETVHAFAVWADRAARVFAFVIEPHCWALLPARAAPLQKTMTASAAIPVFKRSMGQSPEVAKEIG